jgi:hypothetical protein
MSIREFAHFETQKHFYKRILGRIQIDNFTFIGLTEFYKESISLFNRIFDVHLEDGDFANFNEKPVQTDYIEQLKADGSYEEIKDLQQENRLIYGQARRRFEMLYNSNFSKS